ncbi:MAG: hypothetical protein ABIV47_19865 [Roseiflexaceae bacterium]
MPTTMLSGVPLLGALCIAAKLISQAQLARCLELQTHKYPGTPIGRIMVLQGYCTEPDIARIIAQQQAFRREFCAAIDQSSQAPSNEEAAAELVLDAVASSALPELDAFTATELDNSRIFGERK